MGRRAGKDRDRKIVALAASTSRACSTRGLLLVLVARLGGCWYRLRPLLLLLLLLLMLLLLLRRRRLLLLLLLLFLLLLLELLLLVQDFCRGVIEWWVFDIGVVLSSLPLLCPSLSYVRLPL